MECWACGHNLGEHSIFCVSCEKWQNWRKWIDFSSINLSLLVALVSVVGATLPPAIDALSGKTPKFLVTFVDANAGRFELAILNDGEAPAALRTDVVCKGAFLQDRNKVFFQERFTRRGGSIPAGSKGIFPFIMPGDVFEVDFELIHGSEGSPDVSGRPRCTLRYDTGYSKMEEISVFIPPEYVKTIFSGK